jgi:peptide/nickel transport system permease protein
LRGGRDLDPRGDRLGQVGSEAVVASGSAGGDEVGGVRGRSPWQLFWLRLRQDKIAITGFIFITILGALALFAPVISNHLVHHGPNQLFTDTMTTQLGLPKGPNSQFWFGADSAGRDLFVRVLYGARTSLEVALIATGFAVVVGTIVGLIAGFFGGAIDTFFSRSMDVVLSMPLLLFAIGIVAACSTTLEGCAGGLIKPGLGIVIFVIALFSWPYIGRIVRGNTLSVAQKEFVEASRSLGAGNTRIMFREILPNLVAPILVYSSLIIPANIVFEASLSYLGLGVPQSVPSWGRELSDASDLFQVAWWMMVYPGLFLFATTLSFNLLGDGLRDALDPRSSR